ncbi:MAG: GNAT family N-acetyltransferase [Bacteroidota bacterium]
MERIFQTPRLWVRPLVLEDFPGFFAMQGNARVMEYTGFGRAQTKAEARQDLEKCIEAYTKPQNDFWVWALERKEDGQFIGTTALVPDKVHHEIGYRLAEAYWGQGLGQEICNGLLDFVFQSERHEFLLAYVAQENKGSVRILDRSSMVFQKSYFSEEYQTMDNLYHWNWTGHLAWLAQRFLHQMESDWQAEGYALPPLSIDHLCYRVESQARYFSLKEYLEREHTLLIESEIAGRPIATYQLAEPWLWKDQMIDVLELPAPKPEHPYAEGFEHLEVVVPVSLEQFLHRHTRIKVEQPKRQDPLNPTLKWTLPNGVIKFHERSLAEVIELEKAQNERK